MPNLVKVSDYGLKGINYYWSRRDMFHLSEEELRQAGVVDGEAYVDVAIIPALQQANALLQPHGFELIIKDAYRSPELYQLVKAKRYELDGKDNTDKTFDPVTMPHGTGLTVDVNLVDLATGQEMELRNKTDWPDGVFINFYKDKPDAQSQAYQRLQDLLVATMQQVGFKLGGKQEYWHFSYAT